MYNNSMSKNYSKLKAILKSASRFLCGFFDAIKGIAGGTLKVKEATNFYKGSKKMQQKDAEAKRQQEAKQQQQATEKMRNDIHTIRQILCQDDDDELGLWYWLKAVIML